MKLDHKFYDFCPHLLIPSEWGELLKEHCETEEVEAEISPNFYLKVLGSISLDAQGKDRVLIQINNLTSTQISQLEEVFTEELTELEKNFSSERDFLIKTFCDNLFNATTILRLYGVIPTPRDENKILKKIVNQWLEKSEECLHSLQKFQDTDYIMKQVLRYYSSK